MSGTSLSWKFGVYTYAWPATRVDCGTKVRDDESFLFVFSGSGFLRKGKGTGKSTCHTTAAGAIRVRMELQQKLNLCIQDTSAVLSHYPVYQSNENNSPMHACARGETSGIQGCWKQHLDVHAPARGQAQRRLVLSDVFIPEDRAGPRAQQHPHHALPKYHTQHQNQIN